MIGITIANASKTYVSPHTREAVLAFSDINLEIRPGEFICIVGPSGCGKSTLLRSMAGLEVLSKGEARIGDQLITGPGPDRGMLFQDYALFPWRTVQANIEFGLEVQGVDKVERHVRALELIEMIGLKGFEKRHPHELSGGMRQRVALARMLAPHPQVLLMDEPFAALDAQSRKMFQQELIQVWQQMKKTIVFVTHSVIEAVYLADRVVVMTSRPGRIKAIIDVDAPRPRDYTGSDYLRVRQQVLEALESEVRSSFEASLAMDMD